MRIACLVGRFPSWSERFIAREARALSARGHEVRLWPGELPAHEARWCTPDARPEPPLESARARCAWRPVLRMLAGCGLLQVRRLPRVLRAAALLQQTPDVILAHFAGLPAVLGAGLAAGLGRPLVVSVHARDVWVPWGPGLRALARARAVLGCNRAALDALRAHFPAHADIALPAVHLVHHGIDWDARAHGPPLASRGGNRILACGRFVPKKGFSVLLQALVRARETRADLCLRLIGEGPEHLTLGRERVRLGLPSDAVEIRPRQPPEVIEEEMRAADVLAVPSVVGPDGDRDGIPNVLLEAWAAGTPVVASRVGGIPEALEDGQTGWLVPPNDTDALAQALLAVLADPTEAARRADQARACGRARFSLGRNATQLETVLQETCA